MWALWLLSAVGLAVAVLALLRASRYIPDPRRHRRVVLGAGAAVLAFLIGPPLVREVAADWRTALGTVAILALVAAALWWYIRLLRRLRARARREGEE